MTSNKQRGLAALILLIIIIIGGIYEWRRIRTTPIPGENATSTDISAVIPIPNTSSGSVTASGNITEFVVEQSVAKTDMPMPDVKRPIACTLSEAACEAVKKQAADIASKLAKDPNDFWSWIDLGTLHKMNNDYQRAATVWEYVSAIYPKNIASFSNLGDLYMNSLHDDAKAEKNYLTAIANRKENIDAYRALFMLYSTGFRGGTAAEDILKKGIAANPKSVDLQVLLARYYKAQGRTADAQAEYQAAIGNARSQNQAALVADLEKESAL